MQWPDPKVAARYAALGQVGLEMVAPIGLGLWLDHAFGLMPWCTIAGALIGLLGGMAHLLVILQQANRKTPPEPADEERT